MDPELSKDPAGRVTPCDLAELEDVAQEHVSLAHVLPFPFVEVPALAAAEVSASAPGEPLAKIAARVAKARELQA